MNHTEPAGLSRRGFLGAGVASAAGWSLGAMPQSHAAAVRPGRATRVIFLLLTGGPSQIDTWDPKPDAPGEVRGPFAAIATRVPGTRVSELFPHTAAAAHRIAIVRSVHHGAAAVHETGLQLLQTGRLGHGDEGAPHFGAVLSQQRGRPAPGVPAFAVLGAPLGNLGLNVSNGQGAGFFGPAHAPEVIAAPRRAPESAATRDRYGASAFGANCLGGLRLIEAGVRCVLVNMFDKLYDTVTWDCHAGRHSLPGTLDDYRRLLAPAFDRAYAALIQDLHDRGLLDETLVVTAGEMGRTPRLNARGGRDHWTGVWSVLLAGGGVRGGRTVGASDKHGAEPACRPVAAQDIAATIYRALGIDPQTRLPARHGETDPLTQGRPVEELFD